MLTEAMREYVVPMVVTAAIGIVGTFGVQHSERITRLETNRDTSIEVQRELVRKVDEISILVTRIDTKLEERSNEQERKSQ